MKEFKPPKGQRVCLQYFRTKSNGTKEILAIVTETNPPGSFSLFMPDGTAWKKTKTSKDPGGFRPGCFQENLSPLIWYI